MMSAHVNCTLCQKIVITIGVLLICVVLGSNSGAQSFSNNAKNWENYKGQMIASGSHHFSNGWTRGPNGKYWKNGEDPYKVQPKHSEHEVRADIRVKKGQFVVQGPGSIGYAYKNKGVATASIWEPGAKANFIPQSMGGLTMNKVKGEWTGKWVQATSWLEMTPGRGLSGWVPKGTTITLDIYTENRPIGSTYEAGTEIHYEYWFFPKGEGGKILQATKTCEGGVEVDVTDGDKPCPLNEGCDNLRHVLAKLMQSRRVVVQSINDIKGQLDALGKPKPFNTGYLNEFQNNTLGNDPIWNKKNLQILHSGAGGGTVSYLYDKSAWEKTLNTSLNLQKDNLGIVNLKISTIQKRLQQLGCKY